MAKTTTSKTGTSSAKPSAPVPPTVKVNFAFGKENYILLLASVIVLIIGYALMSGGKPTDPNVFNEEVFSFRRITLAPIVVMIGYALGVWAIVKKAA